jgi:hypothetical protein
MLGTGCTEEHAQLLGRFTAKYSSPGHGRPGLEAVQRAIPRWKKRV